MRESRPQGTARPGFVLSVGEKSVGYQEGEDRGLGLWGNIKHYLSDL